MVIFEKQVKQVLKGQSVTNKNATYTLIQDLLRGNTLTVFNNKQVTFNKQSLENLKHCLNDVTVQVFPNKAYKLQKRYVQHMTYRPRYIYVCKWIAIIIKLNNYLTEFPTPIGIVTKKLEDEEILEVLENKIPTSWKFQMDKEGFNASSRTINFLQKPVFATRNVSQKRLRKAAQLVKITPRGGEVQSQMQS
jgi:hypothetical protein